MSDYEMAIFRAEKAAHDAIRIVRWFGAVVVAGVVGTGLSMVVTLYVA